MQQGTVERSVRLAAPFAEVWEGVTTPEGINDELRPWMRMTVPKGFQGTTLADVEAPASFGRSWVLFLGFIPFDYDDLHIEAIGEGWFRERSTMLSASAWSHDRTLEVDGTGTRVTDALGFVLRRPLGWIPGAARFYSAVIRTIFGHRHRRLVRRFGAATA